MFITIQPEVYGDKFCHENIMAAHKIVTHLTLSGSDGVTYSNMCEFEMAACMDDTIELKFSVSCEEMTRRAREWAEANGMDTSGPEWGPTTPEEIGKILKNLRLTRSKDSTGTSRSFERKLNKSIHLLLSLTLYLM